MDTNDSKELLKTNKKDWFHEFTGREADQFEEYLDTKQYALGGMGGMGLLSSFFSQGINAEQAANDVLFIDRAVQSKDYFNKNIDPRLKNLYLKQGEQGLKFYAGDILKELIPASTSPFIPADLSMAGKYKEALENITPINYPIDNITVTPGPNPGRFATSELTPIDTGEQGAKGYIWGNPAEPQWSYAKGNYNKNPNTTTNPTLYMTKLDLPPESKGRFKRTDEVVNDPTLIENRRWGQRAEKSNGGEGDLYFPKENIKARGEVTAADLYTRIKKYGFDPGPITNEREPGEYFQKLADRLATLEGTPGRPAPIKQVLENIATPVPTFGSSERERGTIPVFKEFDILNASSEQRARAGIDKIFLDPTNTDYEFSHVFNPISIDRKKVNLALPINLSNPSTSAGRSFKNVNTLKSGGFLAGALYSPEVFKDLEKKRYGSALTKAGAAAATGALMEGVVRTGVVNAAKAGITLPARALAYANPVVAAISMATLAPGSSRITTPRQEAYENQLREIKFKQAEAARQRGSKWTFPTPFGKIKIPELGISESGGLFVR